MDLSKPNNIVESLLRWITAIRKVISKNMADLKSKNSETAKNLKEMAMAPYAENPDRNRVKPCEIPMFIVASKWDSLKTRQISSSDRKIIVQALRFIAHYNGASLYCTSTTEPSLKESFRAIMGAICFRTALKSYTDTSSDRPVYVSAGTDDFDSILLGAKGTDQTSDSMSFRPLVHSEAELNDFITTDGVTKKCWDKFRDFFLVVFGPPMYESLKSDKDKDSEMADDEGKESSNEFPEADMDAARAAADSALQRYRLEASRKEALLQKTYEQPANSSSETSITDMASSEETTSKSSSRRSKLSEEKREEEGKMSSRVQNSTETEDGYTLHGSSTTRERESSRK